MNFKAILFDLDGTLRHNEPNGYETFIRYLTELGVTLTTEQLAHVERWTHYYWSVAPELQEDIEALGADTPEFWWRYSERQIRMFELPNAEVLAQQVHDRFNADYHPVNRVPEDVRPTWERLRAAGFTVGLVSNRLSPLDAIATELGFDGLFHFTLSAGQAGAWKPSPQIFQRAVALANCAPSEAVYVGDNFYADIEGARGAGLTPVLIDPRGLFPEPGCTVIHFISALLTCGIVHV